jgi:hypothetical protein
MADKENRKMILSGMIAGIWIGVVLVGVALFIILNQYNATAAEVSQDELSLELSTSPTDSFEPAVNQLIITYTPLPGTPTATLPPTTATPLPEVAVNPIVFPTMVPTSDAQWEGPIVIGYSVQGRPIEVYRFGKGSDKYLVIGGIHGGYEINTIYLTEQLIKYFSKKPDAVPTNTTLFILRSLNPDGEALPHKKEGRSNANLVDLNRSFPVGWSAEWNRDGCWDLMELNAGAYPASEPETIALMAFVLENPVIAVVSYHAAAPGFYPAGEPLDPASIALSEYLSAVTGYPYPPINTGCYMTGSLVDWTLTTGAAGVDVELSTHWDTEFDLNLNLVLALLRWKPNN